MSDSLSIRCPARLLLVLNSEGTEVISRHYRFNAVWRLELTVAYVYRLRLLEEVDVLQHLSKAAGSSFHPNILGYVDSWEQDDRLFILTELCEFGNFSHFLNEYGHNFARLDEARVWKIFADISSVSTFTLSFAILATSGDLDWVSVFVTVSVYFSGGRLGSLRVNTIVNVPDIRHLPTNILHVTDLNLVGTEIHSRRRCYPLRSEAGQYFHHGMWSF